MLRRGQRGKSASKKRVTSMGLCRYGNVWWYVRWLARSECIESSYHLFIGWRRSCKRLGLHRSARARVPHLGRFLYKLTREDILELLENYLSLEREREKGPMPFACDLD